MYKPKFYYKGITKQKIRSFKVFIGKIYYCSNTLNNIKRKRAFKLRSKQLKKNN